MLQQGHIWLERDRRLWLERNRRHRYGPEASHSTEKANEALVKAQQVYIKMAKTYPHHSLEGNALVNALNMGRSPDTYELAIEACNVLIEHYPASSMGEIGYFGLETVAEFARRRIARILLDWKGPEEALHYLIPVLESTDNPPALFRLNWLAGKIYEENLHDMRRAMPYYQKALNVDFCREDLTVKVSKVSFRSGKSEIVFSKRWITLSLGKYLEDKGEWGKAAALYNSHLRERSGTPGVREYDQKSPGKTTVFYQRLGYCFEQLGEWQKALDAYQRADPRRQEVQEGIKRCRAHLPKKEELDMPVTLWMDDDGVLKTIGHFPKPPAYRFMRITHVTMLFAQGELWLGFGPRDNVPVKNMERAGSPWNLSVIRYNHGENKVEKVFGKEQGLPSFGIISMAAAEDAVWAGTIGGGLIRLSKGGDAWKVYTTKDGLGNNNVLALLADGKYLWVGGGSDQAGVLSRLSLDGGVWSNYAAPKILDSAITNLIDQGDHLLVGTRRKSFFKFKKETGIFTVPYKSIFEAASNPYPGYIPRDAVIRNNTIWWKSMGDSGLLWSFNLRTLSLSSRQPPAVIKKASWRFMTGLTRVGDLLLSSFARGDIGIFDTKQQEWQAVIISQTDNAIGITYHDGYIYIATQNGQIRRLSEATLRKCL